MPPPLFHKIRAVALTHCSFDGERSALTEGATCHEVGSWTCEEVRNDHVDDGGKAECQSESLHLANGQHEQENGCQERHRIACHDGAEGAFKCVCDGRSQPPSMAVFLLGALEVHDVRIERDTDRDDHTCDARERKGRALGLAQENDDAHQEGTKNREADNRDDAKRPIVEEHVGSNQKQSGESGEQTCFEAVSAERGRYGLHTFSLEGCRQCTVSQDGCKILRILFRSISGTDRDDHGVGIKALGR